ncbi:hypothetical protein NHX12_025492 [Muraenolepis orangiensis]|uniref:CFA20 domain-containing protein n=1 Tax=Muraenolepis orangiensis TaxID=630683 RepID=A0A9Q0EJ91_9TELE|nr:hypothetical protein NHX12_025492 [Muraenolepis orangiensis]
MASRAWQHPYVNIFKHVKIEEWKRCSKEGDVSVYMDKTLRCPAFRIKGSIPASNYVLVPKVSTQSLALTGRYFYLLFRPTSSKYFVVHLDVAVEEGVVVRIAFSNMFKDFKSTATSLQFPFICGSAKDSVYEATAKSAKHGLMGPAPPAVRWTCLSLDLHYMLSVYLNLRHSHLKSVKLCSNMAVKNMFTSDLLLDPGLSFSEAKQRGLSSSQGTGAMPRDMSFPCPRASAGTTSTTTSGVLQKGPRCPLTPSRKAIPTLALSPVRDVSRSVDLGRPVKDHVSLIQQLTTQRRGFHQGSGATVPKPLELPICGPPVAPELPDLGVVVSQEDGLHQSPREPAHSPAGSGQETYGAGCDGGTHVYVHRADALSGQTEASQHMKRLPDPTLRLNRIIGFGGATASCALWTKTGDAVVYPCHAIVVSMTISSGQQKFFIGHTDKTGSPGVVRLLSCGGGVLCGVGKDKLNKTLVVVWDTAHVHRRGEAVAVLAKAHTDVDVRTMKVAHFDDTR